MQEDQGGEGGHEADTADDGAQVRVVRVRLVSGTEDGGGNSPDGAKPGRHQQHANDSCPGIVLVSEMLWYRVAYNIVIIVTFIVILSIKFKAFKRSRNMNEDVDSGEKRALQDQGMGERLQRHTKVVGAGENQSRYCGSAARGDNVQEDEDAGKREAEFPFPYALWTFAHIENACAVRTRAASESVLG